MKKRIESKGWALVQVKTIRAPGHLWPRGLVLVFKRIDANSSRRWCRLLRFQEAFGIETGDNSAGVSNYKSKNTQKPDYKSIDMLKPYIKDADNYYYFKVNEDWLAIDRVHKDGMGILQQHLYLKKSGVRLGSIAGKDLIPDHELALSLLIHRDAVLNTGLTRDQAIAYLRRDNIPDLNPAQKGWSLMTFENHPLGWAKLLPNRINNYYPKEMRIMNSVPGS